MARLARNVRYVLPISIDNAKSSPEIFSSPSLPPSEIYSFSRFQFELFERIAQSWNRVTTM